MMHTTTKLEVSERPQWAALRRTFGVVVIGLGIMFGSTVTVRAASAIEVDLAGPPTVIANNDISYAINWRVSGDTPVSNASITVPIPTHTSWKWSDSFGALANNQVTWTLGNKGAGMTGVLYLILHADVPVADGTLVTTTVTFDTDQTNPVSDAVTTTVSSQSTLKLDLLAPETANAGQLLTYTMHWTVGGTAPAENVTLLNTVPANTTVQNLNGGTLSGGIVTWNLGTRNPGAKGTTLMTVRVNAPLPTGTIIDDVADLTAAATVPVTDTVRTTAASSPKLSIAKATTTVAFTNPGKTVTYTVTVKNAADAGDTARNVTMTDTLPTGFSFTDGSGTTKVIDLGSLAPGATVTKTYTAAISAQQPAGRYTNTVTVQGSNVAPLTATATVEVRIPTAAAAVTPTPAPTPTTTPAVTPTPVNDGLRHSLVVTKTADKAVAVPNDIIVYTITTRNISSLPVTNIVITDVLPAGLTDLTTGQTSMRFTIDRLEAGATKKISFPTRLAATFTGSVLKNGVTVVADSEATVNAENTITLRQPQVKGLATTGPGLRDYAFFTLGGFLIVIGGIILFRQRHPESIR